MAASNEEVRCCTQCCCFLRPWTATSFVHQKLRWSQVPCGAITFFVWVTTFVKGATFAALQRHFGVVCTFIDAAFVACLFGVWHRMNYQNIYTSVAAGIEVRCKVRFVFAFAIFSRRSGGWASRLCLNRLLLTCRQIGVKHGWTTLGWIGSVGHQTECSVGGRCLRGHCT